MYEAVSKHSGRICGYFRISVRLEPQRTPCLPHRGHPRVASLAPSGQFTFRGTTKRWRGCASDDRTLPQSAFLTAPSWRGPRVSTHFVHDNDRGIRAIKKRPEKSDPTQISYHIPGRKSTGKPFRMCKICALHKNSCLHLGNIPS